MKELKSIKAYLSDDGVVYPSPCCSPCLTEGLTRDWVDPPGWHKHLVEIEDGVRLDEIEPPDWWDHLSDADRQTVNATLRHNRITVPYGRSSYERSDIDAFGKAHEGKAIIYDSYPDGTDIAAVIEWNAEENAYVAQNTGAWKAYFDSIGISDYIVLIDASNIRFEGEPSEPPRSN